MPCRNRPITRYWDCGCKSRAMTLNGWASRVPRAYQRHGLDHEKEGDRLTEFRLWRRRSRIGLDVHGTRSCVETETLGPVANQAQVRI